MNKQDLKDYVRDILVLKVWDIDSLIAGEYKDSHKQEIWNSFKKETRGLIECYIRGYFYYTIAGDIFLLLFDKTNNYELRYNVNNDYVDKKGNIKFTSYDYLNVNFDSVVDTIVEFEFMNE